MNNFYRLDFQWKSRLELERKEAKVTKEINRLLLKNILPIHVANKYMNNSAEMEQLYCEEYSFCAVMFASITNFMEFYTETDKNEQGLQCLKILNKILVEFDTVSFGDILFVRSCLFSIRRENINVDGDLFISSSFLKKDFPR